MANGQLSNHNCTVIVTLVEPFGSGLVPENSVFVVSHEHRATARHEWFSISKRNKFFVDIYSVDIKFDKLTVVFVNSV